MNRIYLNNGGVAVIEYLYKMDDTIDGRGGIFIPITACTAYYIGISLIGNHKLFIEHVEYNSMVTIIGERDLMFTFNENVYYLLHVQIRTASTIKQG